MLLHLHSIAFLIWISFLFTVGSDVFGVVEHLSRLMSEVEAVSIMITNIGSLLRKHVYVASRSNDGLLLVLVLWHQVWMDVHNGAVALYLLTNLNLLIGNHLLQFGCIFRWNRIIDDWFALGFSRCWWNWCFLNFFVFDRLWVIFVLFFESGDLRLDGLVIIIALCNEAVAPYRWVLVRALSIFFGSAFFAVFLVDMGKICRF